VNVQEADRDCPLSRLFSSRPLAGYARRVRSLVGLGLALSLSSLFACGCAASASASFSADVAAEARSAAAEEPASEPDEAPASRRLAASTGNPWVDCYRAFQPTADAAVDLEHLTQVCARKLGLAPLTPVHVGSQRQQERSERLRVSLRRGRCYRAFAVGQSGIIDLDLAIFDPDGGLVAADLSHDRWSVAPPRSAFCPARSGRYALDIAVTEGAGDYLAQVWGTAPDSTEDDDDASPPGD
jgi:hypothetical protein